MKFLKTILSKLGPKSLEHPVFGRLLLMKMPDPSKTYWEGKGVFAPTGSEIELFIDGTEDGPHPGAVDLYHDIGSRYPDLISAVRSTLGQELEQWIGHALPEKFQDEFSLSSVSIPNPQARPLEWDMSFVCASDEHLFTVQFTDWAPRAMTVDG